MNQGRRNDADALSAFEQFEEHVSSPNRSGGKDADAIEQKYARVLEISASVNSTLDLTALLNNVIDGIIQVTECSRGFLMLREPDGTYSSHVGRTSNEQAWDADPRQISSTIVGRVVDSGDPFIESDLDHVDGLDSGSIHEHSIRSAICLPLKYVDNLIGVIYADADHVVPQVLGRDHSILMAFASQAAIAIENARQHGNLKMLRDHLEEQNLSLRQQLSQEFVYAGMVSKNKHMVEVFDTVDRIASHDIGVLIQGESGTGKELLARAIHEKSGRSNRPFETVNCAGIPSGLVESILFGHKKGAFTGATQDKPGLFELADGGTLFLDEIGDMPLDIQPKILRAVQEQEIRRVGEEERVRRIDVRIIAATHVDLARAVGEGRFRQDLYYRLNVAQIMLPPLRARRDDIIPLADHFLAKYSEARGLPLSRLSREAREFLMSYQWEGNVRQLKSAIEWGIVFQDDHHVIPVEALRRNAEQSMGAIGAVAEPEPAGTLRELMADHEQGIIRRVLEENAFNITAAAKTLDISRQQLHNKIRKFGISRRSV